MAQRADESDSSDEYEVMVSPNSPSSTIELSVQQAKTASEVLEISKNFADKEKKSKVRFKCKPPIYKDSYEPCNLLVIIVCCFSTEKA